jgi:hypothetical protein
MQGNICNIDTLFSQFFHKSVSEMKSCSGSSSRAFVL